MSLSALQDEDVFMLAAEFNESRARACTMEGDFNPWIAFRKVLGHGFDDPATLGQWEPWINQADFAVSLNNPHATWTSPARFCNSWVAVAGTQVSYTNTSTNTNTKNTDPHILQ